ncbi:MAG: 3-deoxy-D-manno-octulosonic acid transferase [Bacteroidales bacterium]|nr:3-deoxy-D-manno-octulosonic acid transferase [Bacteroidales bacterium]
MKNTLILYNIFIKIYHLAIIIASVKNQKAKQWISGRKNIFKKIADSVNPKDYIVWFHCASLGEFEQGRPVIEKYKNDFPEHKILLTFFSPSGYEIRKNYQGADYIFYLPLDSKRNAKKFINIVNPKKVIFVKYEFWYHYLNLLYKKNIPTFIISTIFRKNQLFFRWYGNWYRKMLKKFSFIFVQNEISKMLLESININNVLITGDTRFDRVSAISEQSKSLPLIEKFRNNKTCLIAGSTWEKDENILIEFINSTKFNFKYIIAPHEIFPENINRIKKSINKQSLLYSKANEENILDTEVLIIDNIGILSSLYRYGDIALIGGGFGKGIHNILEAAAFGLPVLFGPKYQKFNEAIELLKLKGAFSFKDYNDFSDIIKKLQSDKIYLKNTGEISKNFVNSKKGVTNKILDKISNI